MKDFIYIRMINNYTNFLIEKELKHWVKLQESLNEDNSLGELRERVLNYLDDAARRGDDAIIRVAKKIFDFFKTNPKMLILVISILVAKYNFSKNEIIDMVPDTNIVSAEEIYAKAMEGRGLPEDWVEESDYDSEEPTVAKYVSPVSGTMKKYLTAIADKESSLDPEKVNSEGYMGKYQFGEIALKDIIKKLPVESKEEHEERIKKYWPTNFGKIRNEKDYNFFQSRFRNRGTDFWPEHKQDLAMKQLLKNNKAYLGDYIDKWVGKKKEGINITLSGLLAGAHLLGPSNVKAFLDHGTITKDGYGTPITEYIKKFGGYNINL